MTEAVTITLTISAEHPAFSGHFPGRPIIPGALLIDLAVRTIEQATARAVTSIAQAKFLGPATPGEKLLLSFECTGHSVRFDITTPALGGERKLASGRMSLKDTSP